MRKAGGRSQHIRIGGNDMTIDEAIAHAREVADENIKESMDTFPSLKSKNCIKCAEEYEQLAEWLEELKKYKEKPEGWMWDEAEMKGYNKAIDDFINACKEDILCQTFGLHANRIERIAEQLKAGVTSGTYNQ